ncbi:MAG: aminotransferase class V-fold PLP-dependent enzyme [Aerococcaceae bacterium]|nr:aminotransferase class V-fold PLP-dependent enzyme [Aerococcaceae bacterium]
MEAYPLKSLSIIEAQKLQFKLIECITHHFSGNEILTRGDLGITPKLNRPITTDKVEKVIAEFFNAEAAMLVRGSGTNAIRLAMHSILKKNQTLLIHDAPMYPTTKVSLEMLGIESVTADYNDYQKIMRVLDSQDVDGVLIQTTRQKLTDSYDLNELIHFFKSNYPELPIITDDNYAVLKTAGIGCEFGADLSCFSTFKLLGPEGIGCIVGKRKWITRLKQENYSGGGQVQGHEALDVLKGMIYVPVSQAISATVCEEVMNRINNGEIPEIKEAVIVNAQSKVVVLKMNEPIAKEIIQRSSQYGALPNPVGAESKYEFCPLIYRVSGTFRETDNEAEDFMIRINPNRAGADTIMNILSKSINDFKINKV